MAHDGLNAGPVFRVGDEHKRQEIPRFGGDVVGERQWCVDDILVQQVNVVSVRVGRVVIEGKVTS